MNGDDEWRQRAAAREFCSMFLDLRPRLERALHQAIMGDAYLAIELSRKLHADVEAVAMKRIQKLLMTEQQSIKVEADTRPLRNKP